MKFIECKAQWLVRPMTTKTSMDGFEGPATRTEVDDGFGNVMVRGQRTASYNCFFKQTSEVNHSPIYDGTIDIPDCGTNREKIAAHIRSGDLRVVNRALERQILSESAPSARAKRISRNNTPEMPDDFDGSGVVLKSKAMRDADPIEDPHTEDAVFKEVRPLNVDEEGPQEPPAAAPVSRVLSLAEMKSTVVVPASEPPKGVDPRAAKTKPDSKKDMVPDVAGE